MRITRLSTAAIGLFAALSLGVAACGDTGGGAGPAADRPADQAAKPAAKEALVLAANKLNESSFKVNAQLGAAGAMTGAMDMPNRRAKVSMNAKEEGQAMQMEMLMVGTDLYMQLDMGGQSMPGVDPGDWMHLDIAKLPADNSFGLTPGQFDPAGATKLLKAVATAEWVDDQKIKGTLDLTKASGAQAKQFSALGDKAKAIPFEAEVDDEGRLTAMTVDVPSIGGAPAQKITADYTDFGTKVTAEKPPADKITEAPQLMYGIFSA